MKFVELNEEQFKSIQDNLINANYFQTVEWARIKRKTGWESFFVGVEENGKIIRASLLLAKKLFGKKKLFYSPRGLLLDYENEEELSFFVTNLKEFIKEHNGILLKIDPMIVYQNHDKEGNVVGDFKNNKVVDNLIKNKFVHHGFSKGYCDEIQYRWTHLLDITQDNWDKDMNHRCKRSIKKAYSYPIVLEDVNDNNIEDFKNIMEHTAIRQNHFDRSLDYYKTLNKELKGRIRMVIAYLDKDKFLNDFQDNKLYDKIKKEEKKFIPLSAGVFILDNDRLNYVYGGTYSYYMPLMAQYKVQVEMIKYAKSLNIPIYDFGGISGIFEPNTENYGVYEFKRGFGGYVVEFVGEFDLIISGFYYKIYNLAYKTYRNLKKVLSKFQKK